MNILRDKQYKSYNRVSRYSAFPIYYNTIDQKYESGTTAYLKNTTPYVLHKVTDEDDYDKLALEYYNNPTYFWVICSFNHIQDPFQKPRLGSYLMIPIFSSIEFEVY